MKDGLLELDAARLTAAGEAHPNKDAFAEIDHFLRGETKVLPFLKPAADAAHELLTPVVLVGVGERRGLTHLGFRVHQLPGFSNGAPTVHLTQDPDAFLRHRAHYPSRSGRPSDAAHYFHHLVSSVIALLLAADARGGPPDGDVP